MLRSELVLWVLITIPLQVLTLICSRYPSNTLTPKSLVDENFVISVSGNPQTYILGQPYNISLNAFNGLRFVSFLLALENENGDAGFNEDLGYFEITDGVETRYSPKCINMVENTNTNPKTRIDVTWVAPSNPDSNCVLIRATVLQHRDVWYMDDGGLTKRICKEVVDDLESQTIAMTGTPCCACDEARFEVTFESTWSRNLHPKDFPAKGWIARFSDIIGSSHSSDYRFWEYGQYATEGMREFAEHGFSRSLEREFNLNFKAGKIRTIIKARGPAFPNLKGQSLASIRVDPEHHLLSLASKIEPSPDWIVGVSGLELCHANCTWLEQKVINLYPWDIGTDGGPSYTSADQPQVPPDVIRRIRSDDPNDPRSPFFDETGAPMKPLAILTVKRQRIYERLCEDEDSNNIEVPRECFTHPWSPWSECSSKCGEGRQFRTRVYKQPTVAKLFNCDDMVTNREDQSCMGETCEDSERNYNPRQEPEDDMYGFLGGRSMAECELSDWGPWSPCNATCGQGIKMRERDFLNPMSREGCQADRLFKLFDYKRCFGTKCSGDIPKHRRIYGQQDEDMNYNEEEEGTEAEPEGEEGNENNEEWNPETYGNEGEDEYKPESNDNYYENNFENENENDNYGNSFEVGDMKRGDIEPPPERLEMPSRNQYKPHLGKKKLNPPIINNKNHKSTFSRSNNPFYAINLKVPAHCFEPLQIFTCLDNSVSKNYWFFNYCKDECMLYTTDSCDRNANKFNSLEMCEEQCRRPENEAYLKRKQEQECEKLKWRGKLRKKSRRNP